MNFALRIRNENDIVVATQTTAKDYAAANGAVIKPDAGGTLPNICFENVQVPPTPLQMTDCVTNEIYDTTVSEYIGSSPGGR